MRYHIGAALAAALCVAGAAFAQAPAAGPPASEQAIQDFIESHAGITRLDRVARWEDPICPAIDGLPAGFAKFVTQRVRQVAAMVGAPVDADPACKPNVHVAFTTKPQALIDNVRATTPTILGYFTSSSQEDRLATITRPIQAWHVVSTKDLRGQEHIDSRDNDTTTAQNVTGSRTTDGLRSVFHHVLVVADTSKLGQFEAGTLSDSIALLVLSQPPKPEACQELPSITNAITPDCHADKPVTAISDADLAYLRALYKTTLGAPLRVQESEIAAAMKDALAAH